MHRTPKIIEFTKPFGNFEPPPNKKSGAGKTLKKSNQIPNDLFIAESLVYNPCGFDTIKPIAEEESADYGACKFLIGNLSVTFRTAKITAKKVGQFVTIWKRTGDGPIRPFDISDDLDLLIINVRSTYKNGQFIFPKSILHQKGIISGIQRDGKRGMRMYPPWDEPLSAEALKTQKWQLDFFLEITDERDLNLMKAKELLSPKIISN